MAIMEMTFKQWATKLDKPIPCRTMKGEIKRETAKAYLISVQGFLKPSSVCLHCGRELTNPISLLYGLGPVCGGHFYINPLSSEEELAARYSEMCEAMAKVKFEGWIPKTAVVNMVEYIPQGWQAVTV